MKIANVVAVLAMAFPMASALRGVRKNGDETRMRMLKGDKEDDEGGTDSVIPDLGSITENLPTCFSAISKVDVFGQGPVSMKDLQLGDRVLTESGTYQEVYAFGHRKEDAVAEFVQLKTANTKIEMTGQHLVYLEDKTNPVRADSVKVGDVLKGNSAVTKIGKVTREGIYAPFTKDGNLVVDGVVASSYVSLQTNGQEFLQLNSNSNTVGGAINTPISQHDYVHMGLSPFRLMCMGISKSLCDNYNEEGMPAYPAFATRLNLWLNNDAPNAFVQALVLLAVVFLTGMSLLLENTVGATWAPSLVLAAGATYAAVKATGVSLNVRKCKVKTV